MTKSIAMKRAAEALEATRFYNEARNYREAANELHGVNDTPPPGPIRVASRPPHSA